MSNSKIKRTAEVSNPYAFKLCDWHLYLPHTTHVKWGVVFKGKYYFFQQFVFTVGHYSSIFPFLFQFLFPYFIKSQKGFVYFF